ncbi:MAG: hypothetical protein PHI94_03380 [Eubacteriaceae bacterium]|nr:hypothetical protein [Eubacteriaceae bacterium]MDD4507917.1 hypothetical protein [Eubacteriaceae bacterium]
MSKKSSIQIKNKDHSEPADRECGQRDDQTNRPMARQSREPNPFITERSSEKSTEEEWTHIAEEKKRLAEREQDLEVLYQELKDVFAMLKKRERALIDRETLIEKTYNQLQEMTALFDSMDHLTEIIRTMMPEDNDISLKKQRKVEE